MPVGMYARILSRLLTARALALGRRTVARNLRLRKVVKIALRTPRTHEAASRVAAFSLCVCCACAWACRACVQDRGTRIRAVSASRAGSRSSDLRSSSIAH